MTPDMFASADDIASLSNMARYVDDWLLPGVLDHLARSGFSDTNRWYENR
jgi:hypothetical protein